MGQGVHHGVLLGCNQPLPSAGAVCAAPKAGGISWCFHSSPPKHRGGTSQFPLPPPHGQDSERGRMVSQVPQTLALSWLQNTHLLALKKIAGTKRLVQMKGESIAGTPGLKSHNRITAGAGQGLQVQGRGCRYPGEPSRCEVRGHQALSEVGLALSGSSSWQGQECDC